MRQYCGILRKGWDLRHGVRNEVWDMALMNTRYQQLSCVGLRTRSVGVLTGLAINSLGCGTRGLFRFGGRVGITGRVWVGGGRDRSVGGGAGGYDGDMIGCYMKEVSACSDCAGG